MNSQLLQYVHLNDDNSTLDFATKYDLDHQDVVGVLKQLEASEKLTSTMKVITKLELTIEGQEFVRDGSYEFQLFNIIPTNGIRKEDLIKSPKEEIGFTKAMTNKWIGIIKKDGEIMIERKLESVIDEVCNSLRNLNTTKHDKKAIDEYKKRKLVKDVTIKYFIMEKGPMFSLEAGDCDEIAVLTEEHLKSSKIDLENIKFKKYNVKGGFRSIDANLHPLLKMRSEYCRILIEMGFLAMPTNNYVESSFWNFDALFQPQDHAARDAHDTFFLTTPEISDKFPQEYQHRVSQVHSNGGYGSQGYKNTWKLEEAKKNLMRTHTTAVSARMLYLLAQKEEFEPVKYFSIDRVFRNESLDATHLAEFHQVEGLVADRGITLGSLKAVIRAFFKKLGMDKVRFKPAFNPYTEPSMEIFGYHTGLDRWIEIGNSGMFRPEMLLPMGLPEDVNVIAWGLSLERPTMIKYGINNIRDMLGPKMDLKKVFSNPICRVDY